jgi:SOS response regulatory protein OraA/RecX
LRRVAKTREPDSAQAAYTRGLRLLGIRARGREELRADLERRGFATAAARSALDRLEAERWLDDLSAARAVVRARGQKYGRARIARELCARGFSEEIAGSVLGEDAGREAEALARVFRRLWRSAAGLPLPRRRQRVHAALSRRGFAPEAISAMIRGSHEVDGGSGEIP